MNLQIISMLAEEILRDPKDFLFWHCESILTHNLTSWFGNRCVITGSQSPTYCSVTWLVEICCRSALPSMQDINNKRYSIGRDQWDFHGRFGLCALLQSIMTISPIRGRVLNRVFNFDPYHTFTYRGSSNTIFPQQKTIVEKPLHGIFSASIPIHCDCLT